VAPPRRCLWEVCLGAWRVHSFLLIVSRAHIVTGHWSSATYCVRFEGFQHMAKFENSNGFSRVTAAVYWAFVSELPRAGRPRGRPWGHPSTSASSTGQVSDPIRRVCHFAESCVFSKQSLPPMLCHQRTGSPSTKGTETICRVPSMEFTQRLRGVPRVHLCRFKYGVCRIRCFLDPATARRSRHREAMAMDSAVTDTSPMEETWSRPLAGAVSLYTVLQCVETREHSAIMIGT
jgi:hypothetical protein